jgi:hypothetical protein
MDEIEHGGWWISSDHGIRGEDRGEHARAQSPPVYPHHVKK